MRFLDYRHKKPVLNNSVDKDGSGKRGLLVHFDFEIQSDFKISNHILLLKFLFPLILCCFRTFTLKIIYSSLMFDKMRLDVIHYQPHTSSLKAFIDFYSCELVSSSVLR